ncbi:hypothetical protein CK203_065772 [Vitis vinifera]|uniref:Uncharacterized protein n=1 Tax=Vitis vinifera TaxID=29760 RepID=A0A438GCR6_VITVI|nr:hypothetical protein CK203_065772 [Vitis vinifera]
MVKRDVGGGLRKFVGLMGGVVEGDNERGGVFGQGGWNLSLARDFNDWEIDQIGEMLNLLKDFRFSGGGLSEMESGKGNDVFGAKGAYRSLSGYSVGAFPNRRIWMDRVPTKVSFLLGGSVGEDPHFG